MIRRSAFVLLVGAAALVAAAPTAGAHALLVTSDPAGGVQLDAAPAEVTIVFSEEPEPAFSDIQVLDGDGASVAAGEAEVLGADPASMRVGLTDLGEGVYTVAWRVISKVDGHATAGAFAFGIGVDPATAPLADIPLGVEEPTPSPLEVAGRWALYAGLGLLLGAAWVGAGAFATAPAGVLRLARGGWIVAVAGLVLLAEAQRRPTGSGIGALLGTSIGRALIIRAVALSIAGVAVWLAHRRTRPLLLIAGGAALAAIAVHASAGHAGTGDGLWFKVAGQAIHFGAAGVWLGGLAALLAGLRDDALPPGERQHAVRRFSFVAGIALAFVVVSGLLRSFNELPALSSLWESWYGRVILIKVALLAILAVLGGVNRYRHVEVSDRTVAGLRRVSRVELIIAALTLVAAGALATLSPPVEASAGEQARGPIALEGADFASTMRVRLDIDPGFAGPNTFRARIEGFHDAEPISGANVRLLFRYLDDVIGETELSLDEEEAGLYAASSSDMALDGRYRINVLVQRSTGSAEIELRTTTRCRAQAIPVPGGPTLYDVQLSEGRTAQSYADPGSPGFNEIHVTYFDEGGQELDVEQAPRFTATARDREPVTLDVRRFGPGHFIGEADLEAGAYRFDITLDGDPPVRTCFEETITE